MWMHEWNDFCQWYTPLRKISALKGANSLWLLEEFPWMEGELLKNSGHYSSSMMDKWGNPFLTI